MKNRITFISPYEELGALFQEVVSKEKNEIISTYNGDLELGLQHARQAKKLGKTVFISRGGTAKMLQEHTNYTIVEIKVTGYDLLRVLSKYANTSQKIAIIGYDNVVSGSKTICDILNIQALYMPIAVESEVNDKVLEAIALDAEIIVGDTLSCRVAQNYNLQSDLIKSGREAILNAYEEALNVGTAIHKEQIKRERYKTILNSIKEGILVTDSEGRISLCNPVAEKALAMSLEDMRWKRADLIIPNSRIMHVLESGIPEIGAVQDLGNSIIATNRIPIIVDGVVNGVVVSFTDVTDLQRVEKKIRLELSKKGLLAKKTFDDIIGKSSIMLSAIHFAKEYAKTDSTILLTGESGTGKEIFAQAIHNQSNRKNSPFVAINCAAIPASLLESELFGYVDGAFTGASKGGKKGLFELAHGGTVFLDEIGEMPINIQSRILRVLQEREIMRLGDDGIIPIDVRVIAATNRNLMTEIQKGVFREDLYYRINVLNIKLPSLRERKSDILVLADYFNKKFAKKFHKCPVSFTDEIKDYLQSHEFRGNIRELENIITKIVLMGQETFVENKSLVLESSESHSGDSMLLTGSLREIEYRIVTEVLKEEKYNKSKTAVRLGITRVTLNNKLKGV